MSATKKIDLRKGKCPVCSEECDIDASGKIIRHRCSEGSPYDGVKCSYCKEWCKKKKDGKPYKHDCISESPFKKSLESASAGHHSKGTPKQLILKSDAEDMNIHEDSTAKSREAAKDSACAKIPDNASPSPEVSTVTDSLKDLSIREVPLKDLKCNEIRTPKAKKATLDYDEFCARVEFVFSTVNDNEFNAATTMIKAPDIDNDCDVLTNIYVGVFVGMMGNHPVGVIQHSPGRLSENPLKQGLQKFPNAEYLVGVGVCYGFSRNLTSLADVLISKQIIDLGPYRISKSSIETRGDHVNMKEEINAIFCRNPDQVEGLKVTHTRRAKHFVGKIVSGPTLVDNADLKQKIYEQGESKAYGGEMEGGELLQLQKNGINMPDGSKKFIQVIIIKAVTDFADGTKCKEWQFIGAQAAFHYVKCKMEIQPVKYPKQLVKNPNHPVNGKETSAAEKTVLTEDHHSIICPQLKSCSHDWESIAMALHFKPSETRSIKSDPMLMLSKGWMNEVIQQWLRWGPGDERGSKELPTLETLQAALNKANYARIKVTIQA